MKIRTDFVTNSSSYSSAEIVIDNPVLLEILQKYKDKGAFEYIDFAVGNYKISCPHPPLFSESEIGGVTLRDLVKKPTKTPAFYISGYDDISFYRAPERLGDVLSEIIYFFEESAYGNDEMVKQILTELNERREEIDSEYKQVVWNCKESNNEDNEEAYIGSIYDTYLFIFEPERGEEYYHSRIAGGGVDQEIDDGYIFLEEHKINGMDVGCRNAGKDIEDDAS